MKPFWRTHGKVLSLLAALAVLAYLPLLSQPLLQDDYPNIEQARLYGPVSGWPAMLSDFQFRYRATSWVLTYWIERLFGVAPLAFYLVSIALHIGNTWLVYALGSWKVIGWPVSTGAAGFFAVYEGHQEAVMWYSASNELLLFLFGGLTLLFWVRFAEQQGNISCYLASLFCFVLALLSKESAVVIVPLLCLPLLNSPVDYRRWVWLLPFVALTLGEMGLIFSGLSESFRASDGSFSLDAPFWITLPTSLARLLWPWGLIALVATRLCRGREYGRLHLISFFWMGIALLPYSFLTYMRFVPSRQTYLASLGLAWIVGSGFLAFHAKVAPTHRKAVLATALLALSFNAGLLWTQKRRQFLERAAPTEALLALAQNAEGNIYVRCYPDARIVAEAAVRLRTEKPASILLWPEEAADRPQAAADFCWKRD